MEAGSYPSAEQRTHEIGVRVALGAQRASVIGLIVRQGSIPVVIGVMVGIAGAFAVGRAMRELLFSTVPQPTEHRATSRP